MSYTCISCDNKSEKLYHKYKGGIIKITVCDKCGKVVDKYIEYDLVIVSLDALLLKRQAFRHILINRRLKSHWKILLVLLICEAITKLLDDTDIDDNKLWKSGDVIYSALEIDLYWNFIFAGLEMFSLISGVLLCIYIFRLFLPQTEFQSFTNIIHGLVLSCLGKILILPAILWGLKTSTLYVQLCMLFTVAANVQALRVLLPDWNTIVIMICIVCGHTLANLTSVGLQTIKTVLI
ncbi:sterol homeostasis protein [Mactra antiquata]